LQNHQQAPIEVSSNNGERANAYQTEPPRWDAMQLIIKAWNFYH
jgi:hypothetical protein